MKTQLALIAGVMLLVLAASAYAHHPFAADYDWTKPVTVTGTVTKLEWTQPHAMLYIDAKDKNGQMKQMTLEMGSPTELTRAGWTRTTVKQGDTVTVDAWLAKTENNKANVKSVRLSDGRELSGASSILMMKPAKNKPITD